MRIVYAALAATFFLITLNTGCEVKAAGPAVAGAAAAEKPNADPRFAGLSPERHAYYRTLEEEEPRLMAAWFELRDLYAEAETCARVFGLQDRRQARARLGGVLNRTASQRVKFYKMYDKMREPIEREEQQVKERAMKLSEKTGTQEDPAARKQLDELYAVAYALSDKLNALKELQAVFARNPDIPTDLQLLGRDDRDSVAREVAQKHPKLIEARLLIKDCEADMARLQARKAEAEKDPQLRWSSSDEAQIKRTELMLERAVDNLEKEAVRAKQPFEREAEKYKSIVAKTQDKIQAMEKSKRKTTTYDERLGEYSAVLDSQLKAIAVIDSLAVWKEPEQKAPAPKPAAKRGAAKDVAPAKQDGN